MNDPTPKNYSTVCPYSMVFSADIKENVKNNESVTMHGEVKIGDTIIMMGRASKDYPANNGMNYVYVNNVDATYQKAIDTGSTSVFSPADRFYGVREAGFKDLQENTWFIAQFIEDVSTEDMEKGFAEKRD